jgi:hypothetical protein
LSDRKAGDRGGPAEKVGDILKRVLKDAGLAGPDRQIELSAAWRDVAGHEIAGETSISSFRGGVLTIGVGSAPLKHELEVFQREELLAALRTRLGGTFVSELRFILK